MTALNHFIMVIKITVISTLDINECQENSENLCSDGCVDEPNTYSCNCPEGRTLAKDGFNCGGTFHLISIALCLNDTINHSSTIILLQSVLTMDLSTSSETE
jgi:hypothetical protein